MYVETVPNRNSPPAILLREAWRQDGKVKKKTLANLTHWPEHLVQGLRLLLSGKQLAPAEEIFHIERSRPHGHVEALLAFIRHLGVDKLISSTPSRERDLVLAMIVERILHGASKLASTRYWHTTTLAEELKVEDCDEDDLYDALDWLLERQQRIEEKLARRHLGEGSFALYDVSSSYYEGHTCPLSDFGHNRDGKRGKEIIVYGLLANPHGCPVGIDVYPGNTADPKTLADQVHKLLGRFGLKEVTLVSDRGLLTQARIDALKEFPGISYLTALRSVAIRDLVEGGDLQVSLFDTLSLCEFDSQEYPGERLVACFNPFLAAERKRKREELLVATEEALGAIARDLARRTQTPLTAEAVALKVGRVINRRKMQKHFDLVFGENFLSFSRNAASIAREAALDGIYVIRTSVRKDVLSAEDAVVSYKSLSQVEQAFRCLKGIDIRVRPIRHRTEDHVRAHFFLCMLAYYVEWHLRKALGELLFDDTDLEVERWLRDPVAPAKPSRVAEKKKSSKKTPDGSTVHSLETALAELGTRCRHICSAPGSQGMTFSMETEFTPWQKKVFDLLKAYVPNPYPVAAKS